MCYKSCFISLLHVEPKVLVLSLTSAGTWHNLFCLRFPVLPATMTALWACQVSSVQSWSHVTPLAACQKLIVLIGERQSCNKALRGDPPTLIKALRFVFCQGLAGNRHVHWPEGHKGRTHNDVVSLCVCGDRSGQGHELKYPRNGCSQTSGWR